MFLEPRKQTAPAVFRRLLTIARPIVRIEGVRRIWVDDNRRRTVGSPQGLLHLFHGPQQNPVTPSLSTFPSPEALIHFTAASRSVITCASGTFATIVRICSISLRL